jgi:acyl-CoA dehydrogenase
MDFDLTSEEAAIVETASRYATDRLSANVEALDRGEGRAEFLTGLKGLAELGYMGLNVSSDYGGSEAGATACALAIQEVAKTCASTAVTMSVTNLVGEVIQAIGSKEQKENYLPKLADGTFAAGSFCLTESGAGSDPAAMKTKAERHGNGWLLNGSKLYITSGEYAGVLVVWAVTDPDAPKGRGVSLFLVDPDTPGITIGKAESKMGQSGSATNEIVFQDCKIPASAMLGEENQGFKIAMKELTGGRINVAGLALGIAQAAMATAVAFVREREQFGVKVADFQGIQWMIADTYTELEAGKLLTLQAAQLKQEGRPYAKAASMAKLFSTEAANRACYTALQLMGGAGYIRDNPLERYARDVRITTIYEGTSEVQRVIIARELMKEMEALA